MPYIGRSGYNAQLQLIGIEETELEEWYDEYLFGNT